MKIGCSSLFSHCGSTLLVINMFGYFGSFVVATLVSSVVFINVTQSSGVHSAEITEGIARLQPAEKVIPKWPVGDYRHCLVNNLPHRLEVLPGLGWDNLRNKITGEVCFYNYSQCTTTEDGHYLIPDDVFVTPIKDSRLFLRSELIDHWSSYRSMTSTTINIEAHGFFPRFSISGSFSNEHQNIKKHQVQDKTFTSRVQLRNHVYSVHLQPDSQLHPKFKNRLLDIAAHMQLKNMPTARYLTDILIRDYGTHCTRRVEAGGILAKVDHISRSIDLSKENAEDEIKASASASFLGRFGVSTSTSHLNTHQVSDSYKNNLKDSQIQTHGGPSVCENFTLDYWKENLMNNLVAIDREGDPLHFVITPESLPELPEELTFSLNALVFKSIRRYYKRNVLTGCTDADSRNFNFQANVDDQSCKSPFTNFAFGGVYQICTATGSPPFDPCVGYTQKNPKTGDFSCPHNYKPILIHSGTIEDRCRQVCERPWYRHWIKECHYECGGGVYYTFWCAAEESVSQNSGYMFGGLYSNTVDNVITNDKSCPTHYTKQRFGSKGTFVCISDDYELGEKFSLPFGGFISCEAGNPLAMKSRKDKSVRTNPSDMPKQCPLGYSQHLAFIHGDCEINYCTKKGTLGSLELPVINRPPFHEKPTYQKFITYPLLIENNDTSKAYMKNKNDNGQWIELTPSIALNLSRKAREINPSLGAMENLQITMQTLETAEAHSSASSSDGGGLSGGATAGITIGVTLLVGVPTIAFFIKRRRANSCLSSGSTVNYQSFNS